MDGGVAAGSPAGAVAEMVGVIFLANEDMPGAASAGTLDLCVAFETKI
ncbi:hypothetical protein Cflav_PD2809 [Pedosphaera parvula Ellin514]|uniref:Uncharacterized protein n=1 Tax=Pedosphaera parvula (strain Ellin514) TaxID=320771 RepID=B9XJX9_PEDPL|nr:hypothetical protein Cflav_PD2809 [Pedosphaera parvula Ellin514]